MSIFWIKGRIIGVSASGDLCQSRHAAGASIAVVEENAVLDRYLIPKEITRLKVSDTVPASKAAGP